MCDNEIESLINTQEPFLQSKLYFSKMLDVNYRYVFYRYDDELVCIYRFDDKVTKIKKFNQIFGFCNFIQKTKYFRDLQMLSPYHESGLPKIDIIFRDTCKFAWMGNLDGVLLNDKGIPVAIIEFQTTTKTSVKAHCNNTWFSTTKNRKGDEQRWKVIHTVAKQSNLPLLIIVWSPNEPQSDIKLKVVKDIIYAPKGNQKAGLIYKYKTILNYQSLKAFLKHL